MSITRQNPNTVFLGGDRGNRPNVINDIAASEAITPGHLIERFNNAGVIRFRKHSVAGGAGSVVALDHPMANKGVDDAYAANDLVEAAALVPGETAWMFIASGQTIVAGAKLESAGDGSLRVLASGVALFVADENKTAAFTGLTRIRVEKA
jgi:hypothetical protein